MTLSQLNFRTLEDVLSVFVHLAQAEDNTLFAQGDVLLAAMDADVPAQLGGLEVFYEEVARAAGVATRTLRRRVLASMTFPPAHRNESVRWLTHLRIAEKARKYPDLDVDAWLARAADERLSAKDVELLIEQEYGGEPGQERELVLRAAEAVVVASGSGQVVLQFGDGVDLPLGARVLVSAVLIEQPRESVLA